jgi:Cd2+/Zn2+-exporting ATPase
LIDHLAAIGFTEYEARVYLALLGEHPTTGYQISKASGIPRSMVYEALGRLASRGAILRTGDERVTHYRPLPPDVLLDRYEQEQQEHICSLRQHLRTLFVSQQEQRLWSIEGSESILVYAAQMMQEAQEEVLMVLADRHIEALEEDIFEAHDRGVKIGTLLTGEARISVGEVARHPPLESELQELTDMLVVVKDRDEGLIASDLEDMNATITNNRHLVLITHQFIWMELFAQRINRKIGPELLRALDADDRRILRAYSREPGG